MEPIITVNFGDATADKPQSKSWTHAGQSWLVVADGAGPVLWKKEDSKWRAQSSVNTLWKGQPNKADVYVHGDDAHVLLVGACALKVAHLRYSKAKGQYIHEGIATLPMPAGCREIETATITHDSHGRYWVASDWNESILVWHSADGATWSAPQPLAQDIDADDISLVVSLKDQISVIWSNQKTESMMERVHMDRDPVNSWSKPIVIEQGDKNADDHLNATVFEDGSMALVTKNSVDQVHQPQFVFRYRSPSGNWSNIPYQALVEPQQPSRPIINHIRNGRIYAMHSVKDRSNGLYHISVNEVTRNNENWEFKELVRLKTHTTGKNGDLTSSKSAFSASDPYLIFFSDDLGHVFEYDLKRLKE
ncbi:hypothetical protein [Dyadobacter jejuensis]|uniref:hypothetical protein n=1 Tax=Dyadobacter jejuensis TaxID=1082580 RepID=UPI0011B2603D|nr:hypothetical protein [Dyadobacter jejuensis]